MRTTGRLSVTTGNNEYRAEEYIPSPERRTRARYPQDVTHPDNESSCSPSKQKGEKGSNSYEHEAERKPYENYLKCDADQMEFPHGAMHIAKFRNNLPRQHNSPTMYDRTADKYGS